jgi:Oxidoreductase family, NAD-binding Rossmann fold
MKDQKKIRLGLIGVGNWALFGHVRVLRLLPEYEIVAIYSQRKEAAMAAATEYGIPHVAESLDALVTDPLVDQVLVLTTSQQHEEGIRAAITAGKDVYCEWPLTPTAAKSAELATLADAAGVKTQIGPETCAVPEGRCRLKKAGSTAMIAVCLVPLCPFKSLISVAAVHCLVARLRSEKRPISTPLESLS